MEKCPIVHAFSTRRQARNACRGFVQHNIGNVSKTTNLKKYDFVTVNGELHIFIDYEYLRVWSVGRTYKVFGEPNNIYHKGEYEL